MLPLTVHFHNTNWWETETFFCACKPFHGCRREWLMAILTVSSSHNISQELCVSQYSGVDPNLLGQFLRRLGKCYWRGYCWKQNPSCFCVQKCTYKKFWLPSTDEMEMNQKRTMLVAMYFILFFIQDLITLYMDIKFLMTHLFSENNKMSVSICSSFTWFSDIGDTFWTLKD